MMRAPRTFRQSWSATQFARLRTIVTIAVVAAATSCVDKLVAPTPEVITPTGRLGVFADLGGGSGVTTLVILVSGPGIIKVNGSLDTLAFNIPLTAGVASGSLNIPAGPDRVITARAFNGLSETHRGSVTTNILEGANPTLQITLVPLVGNVTLTVSIGSTIVIVRPIVASMVVGDTLRLTAEVRDQNGNPAVGAVRWATLNPLKASVDTLGLVTMRDTGEVQVVATYGTVGGASKITGAAVVSTLVNHLTWNGSVNTKWSEPNNWTPHGLGAARVPTIADSVVIPVGPTRMPALDLCQDVVTRDLIIQTGATLNQSCGYAVNVYGSTDVRGTINVPVYLRPNAKIGGSFKSVYVYGDGARMADSVQANYFEVSIPIGTFVMASHTLRVTSEFDVYDGTVTMVAGDTLVDNGTMYWSGDPQTGLLTGGVVFVRGSSFYGYQYHGTGTSRLVFDRTVAGTQTISGLDYVSRPTSSAVRRLEIRNRDGVNICGHVRVTDTLSYASTGTPSLMSTCSSYNIRADGPVITTANTDVATYLWSLFDPTGTSLIGGTWHPTYTDFDVTDAVVKAGLSYVNMRFFASNHFVGNVSATGYLWVDGSGVELALSGTKALFAQYLDVQNGGLLKMTNAADSLIIGEYATFAADNHALQKPNLTAGVLSVGAYLDGYGLAASATGTFKVVMAGTSASTSKYLTRMNWSTRPTQSLYDLEIAPGATYGLCEYVKVTHNMIVRAGATLQEWCGNSNFLNVIGDLIGEAGSTIKPYDLLLSNPTGTANVAGIFTPVYTDFYSIDAPVKAGLGYGNLRFFASNHLLGPTTATGHLWIDGAGVELTINGQTLTVGDYMQLQTGGMLTMTNAADVVTVANYATFNWDGSVFENGRLTAGTLRVGGYFDGYGFSASGTHHVELTGAYPSTSRYITRVNYSTRTAQAFQNLDIPAGSTMGLCEFVAVKGTMTIAATGTLQEWCTNSNHLRIDGNLVTAVGSTLKPYHVLLASATGTSNVAGAFTPGYTDFMVVDAAVRAGLGYDILRFYASNHLLGPTTATGYLWIEGAGVDLRINGQTMTVGDYLQLQTGGTLTMTNAADIVNVANYATFNWDGSTIENGKLIAGTLRVGGYFDGYGFSASGTHHVELTGAYPSTSRYITRVNYSTRAAQAFQHLDIPAGSTMGLCEFVAVKGTLTVATTGTLQEWCVNSNHLRIDGDLVTAAGSTVKPYEVLLVSAFATQHVNGTFSPVYTSLMTTVAAGALKPNIGYVNMQFFAAATLADSLVVSGTLSLNGASANLTLNGRKVRVLGTFDVNTNATVTMANAADSLILEGAVTWNGGGSEAGKLTAGTTIIRGATFCGTNYETSVAHKTVFDRAGTAVRFQCVSSGGVLQPLYDVDVKGVGVSLEGYMNVVHDIHVFSGATLNETSGTGTLWVGHSLLTDAGSAVSNGPSYPSTTKLAVVLYDPSGTQYVNGAYSADGTYFLGLNAFIKPTLPSNGMDYKYMRIDQSTTFQDSTEIDGQLDIINNTIVSLGGHTVVVKGVLNFDPATGTGNGGKLKMVNPLDTLVVASGDPTATIFWDGGDNSTDGVTPNDLLTNGAIKYYGARFYGSQYAARPGSRHRFIFMANGAGTVSLEGAPVFAQMEIRGTKVVNNLGNTIVSDTLLMGPSTTFAGGSSVVSLGALVTGAGSDMSVATFYLDGPTGTRSVLGRFRPTTTYFRAVAPTTDAIKTGLEYSSVFIQGGPYQLNDSTTFAGNLDIDVYTSGPAAQLNLNGKRLKIGGRIETYTSGVLNMSNSLDSLVVVGLVQFDASGGPSTLSAGVMTVGGGFNQFKDNLTISGSHRVVMTNTAAATINSSTNTLRNFQNLDIGGTGAVSLSGGIIVNGAMRILTPVAVTGTTSVFTGPFSSVAGSSFNHSNLSVDDPAGTSLVLGTLTITSTMNFTTGPQTIKVGTGITYANMSVSGAGTVSGGALTVAGFVNLPVAAATLTIPTGSSIGSMDTYGTVTFAGTSTSAGNLQMRATAVATTSGIVPTEFVDFRSIFNNVPGGTINNNISRTSGAGGFRFLTATGSYSQAGGAFLIGPAPIGH